MTPRTTVERKPYVAIQKLVAIYDAAIDKPMLVWLTIVIVIALVILYMGGNP